MYNKTIIRFGRGFNSHLELRIFSFLFFVAGGGGGQHIYTHILFIVGAGSSLHTYSIYY